MQHAPVPANAQALPKICRDLENEVSKCLYAARIARTLMEELLNELIREDGLSEEINAVSYAGYEAERLARELKDKFAELAAQRSVGVRTAV